MKKVDPLMFKVVEDLETTDILDDLNLVPLELKVGDTLQIGHRQYQVALIRDDQGNLIRGSKKDDLRNNYKAFEELKRTGVIPTSFVLDDLCLRNPKNGNVLVELLIPESVYRADEVIVDSDNYISFFMRFDSSIINKNLKDTVISFTRVVFSPCMFGSDFAMMLTESGKKVPITERNAEVDTHVKQLSVKSQLSLYEKEIIRRLSKIVKMLAYGGKIDAITTALPKGAYYSFLLDELENDLISPQLVLEWFDHVDLRVETLINRIHEELKSSYPSIPIKQYSFMDSACSTMRNYVMQMVQNPSKRFNRQELIQLCINEIISQDPLGRLLEEVDLLKFEDFREMADFTYAISTLMDMAESSDSSSMTKQIIGVFDATENILWNVMRKLRLRGILEAQGLYDAAKPEKSALDNLSYLAVMPVEHVTFDISTEFIETYMGNYQRLYAVREGAFSDDEETQIELTF